MGYFIIVSTPTDSSLSFNQKMQVILHCQNGNKLEPAAKKLDFENISPLISFGAGDDVLEYCFNFGNKV